MNGTEFADLLLGGPLGDTLKGFGGDDTLKGFNADDLLRGGAGDDLLRGGAGDDELRGGTGNDELFGGTGDDELFGDAGDDLVVGGKGDDLLVGGKGADEFRFDSNFGSDIIRDFSFAEGDSITLTSDLLNSVFGDAFGISFDENVEIDNAGGLFFLGAGLEIDGNADTGVSVDGNDVTFDFGTTFGNSNTITFQDILA